MDTGDLLGGRYRLTGRIGSGGMGTVYRAHDTRLDRPVAVKTLHEGREVDDVTRARLRAEAQLAGTLRHPGVVQVFDYGEEAGAAGPAPYVVMELVEGTPLSEILRERGPLPAEAVAALVGDIARALEAAHGAGIVHRDLKPSNIQLAPDGRAVLLDFGVARSDAMEPLTETGLIIGSADYLSPEQVLGQRATPASDVFGLGVVAYQSLSATSPFHRDTQAATALARLHEDAPELPATVPAPLRRLVASMLAREPEDRPAAAEVADRAATADRAGPVLPPGPAPSPAPRQRWNRQRLLVIAAAAVVLAGSLGLLALEHRDVPPAGASELDVPAVVGKRAERAVRILHRAGFEAVLEDADGDVPGQVVRQSPDPGRYDGDPTVTLWVTVAPTPTPSPTTGPAPPRPEPDRKPPRHGAGATKHGPGSAPGHGTGDGPDNGHGKGPEKGPGKKRH